jgi:hypothetical protein
MFGTFSELTLLFWMQRVGGIAHTWVFAVSDFQIRRKQ